MSGTNHVVGGTVFTGIFASFWNVNIFSEPMFLFFTAFFAIIPDADHVKSPIGKAFYPLAKWLNTKYGHRTVTHSLIFYLSGFLIVSFIESIFSPGDFTITLIYGFAFFSHLLFDMMTKAGIPLFWPFRKNACVIPGNPELRLKSSDFQTEAICFGVFILLGITCQNLFAQGFWTTYNVQFNDLKHLHQERKMNDNLLLVKFDYSIAAKRHTGEGHLISSTENSAIIFETSRAGQGEAKFHTIKSEHKIHSIEPNKSDKKLKLSDHLFFNITPDSVHKLIKNKAIIQLKLQSNSPFSYIKENSPQSGSSANLEHVFNPVISFLPDSAANDLENRMQLLDYDLQRAKSEKSNLSQSRYRLHARIDSLTVSIAKMDLYTREKEVPHLAKLKTELEQLDQQISQINQANNSGKISLQLQQLKKEKEERKKILVSGYIQIASL